MRSLFALLSVLACTASAALVGAPAAHASGIYLHHDRFEWDHAGHAIIVDVNYVTALGNPQYVASAVLQCNPSDSTKWGSGNNVDGVELSWGAYHAATDNYIVHKSILNGGNIPNCSASYTYTLEDGSQISDSGYWGLRMKYHFATNYANPDNNVSPSIYFDVPWPSGGGGGGGGGVGSSCLGLVTLHGSGTISSCVDLGAVSIG